MNIEPRWLEDLRYYVSKGKLVDQRTYKRYCEGYDQIEEDLTNEEADEILEMLEEVRPTARQSQR